MKPKWLVLGPLAVVGFVAFVALGVWVVMLLWNWLMPTLFGLPTVSYLQALGLLVLSRILFGGHVGRGFRRRSRLRRWDPLSPEERRRLRERLCARPGMDPPEADGA